MKDGSYFQPRLYNNISSGCYWDKKTYERLNTNIYLDSYGYKVYSQNDEDGIIAEIFKRIGTTNKRFIEFGVENGIECNTHYLLLKGWSGLWIEGSWAKYNEITYKFRDVIRDGLLKICNDYITCENVNSIFESNGFKDDIDLLSIDVDGNDYHIMESINIVNPRVIVVEYNGKLPPDCEWIMKYNPSYIWNGTDKHGASLKSLELMAKSKGYQLVGTNISGVNAFFVRKDLVKDLFPLPSDSENLYNPARFINGLRFQNGHPASMYIDNGSYSQDKINLSDLDANSFIIRPAKNKVVMRSNSQIDVSIKLLNQSPISVDSTPPRPIYVSYHINNMDGKMVIYDGCRSCLYDSLSSNEQVDMHMRIKSLNLKGEYILKISMVQEGYSWLDEYVCAEDIYLEVI